MRCAFEMANRVEEGSQFLQEVSTLNSIWDFEECIKLMELLVGKGVIVIKFTEFFKRKVNRIEEL